MSHIFHISSGQARHVIILTIMFLLIPIDAYAYEAAAALIAYIGAYIGITGVAATVATYALAAAFYIGMALGMSTLAKALSGSPQSQKEMSSRGQLVNTCDTQVTLPLVYGRQRVGVNRVFVAIDGFNNQYLHMIGAVCEGEIEGLAVIDGVEQVFLNDKIHTDFGDSFTYEFFTGSPSQTVCATLANLFPEWKDPLRYTAYIYAKFTYDQNKFQGLPELTVVVDGLKIYNPATELTEFSDNPALCARDFLTRRSCRGGMEVDAARVNDTMMTDCASYCTTKGWTCNLCLINNNAAVDNLQQILACFRGDIIYSGTEFKMKYTDLNYEASVMDIDENDIVENNGVSTFRIVQPDIFGTPNAVRMKFVNAEKLYQLDDYVLSDAEAITQDGDYREKEIYLRGTIGQANAMKMANYCLERLRYNKTISFVMGSRGMALEPYDIFRVSVAAYGWVLKVFRVTETTITPSGEVGVTAIEELAAMYDDTYNLAAQSWHDTTLPDVLDTVVAVGNCAMAEEVYYYRGRSYTRLKVTFDPPSTSVYPQWAYADIYVKIGAAGSWTFMTKAVSSYNIDPVEEGKEYFCAIVSVSAFGSKQAFADGTVVSKVVRGKTTVPSDISELIAVVTGNTIKLSAEPVTDPDIMYYEIRQGETWAGATLVARPLSSSFYLPGVRPGTYTFWMCPRDNAGNYGATPASTTATVYRPIAETLENTWAWDFSVGTLSNTEQVTHDGFNALKCSHTGDVLTGTFTSPIYDLGSIKTARIEGDFETHFHAGTLTWANTLGSKTWADWLASLTWNAAFVIDGFDAMTAELYYGETSPPTSHCPISATLTPTVSARYVKVVVTIKDPSLDSNQYLKTLNMNAYTS